MIKLLSELILENDVVDLMSGMYVISV